MSDRRSLNGFIDQAVQRKEKEMAAVAAKIEDEQSLAGKMQKQVKELAVSSILPPQLALARVSLLAPVVQYDSAASWPQKAK